MNVQFFNVALNNDTVCNAVKSVYQYIINIIEENKQKIKTKKEEERMKKNYLQPEIEFSLLTSEDILEASDEIFIDGTELFG